MGVLQRRSTLQPMQSGFTAGQGTDTCLLQCINAIEQAEQDKSSLYYVSYDISKAFDRPPKEIIKLCWHRVGVPEDIVEWLVNLDIGGRCYIKSPWAQNQIRKGQIISETTCGYFTAETGVPQGSSEGAITWLILFDVLLTLIRKATASDLYVRDPNGWLRKQWPTAFADDLMTYAASLEMAQYQAKLVSIFCMLTGLEIAPTKMTARVIYPTEEHISNPMELKLWTLQGDEAIVPIDTGTEDSSLLRYLGIFFEQCHSWSGQLQKLVDKVAEAVRVLTHSRASSTIKWYAVSMSSYAAITYPAKFAPWCLQEYETLLQPLNQILRQLTYNRPTLAAQLITGSSRYGNVDLPDLLPKIQHEKYKMLQRAQENGGLSRCAVDNMLRRVAELNSIPHTDSSPILYAQMDLKELNSAKNWISSAKNWNEPTYPTTNPWNSNKWHH